MSMDFKTGKTYYCRSACDYNCIWEFTVTARTAKTITITDGHGESKKAKIYEANGGEYIYPLGRYSMSPILRATNTKEGTTI